MKIEQVERYSEPAIATNFDEFEKVVRSRRSVRKYTPETIPDSIVEKVLDLGLLAPNSSNLQPYEFLWIKNPDLKLKVAELCMGQQAATTADTLIVCVAKPKNWKKHRDQMLKEFTSKPDTPKVFLTYYKNLVPFVYGVGPLSVLAPIKWLMITVLGFFRLVPRGLYHWYQQREWAVKSTALICENIMLAFRAAGYDSCPMEGFDESRLRRLLKLDLHSPIVMVISAGRRATDGVYGPRYRFPNNQFIKIL